METITPEVELKYVFVHSSRTVQVENEGSEIKRVLLNGNEWKPDSTSDEVRDNIDLRKIADANKRNHYKEFFRKPFKNFLVLSGAGSSIGIGRSGKVGLSMNSIWSMAKDKIGAAAFDKLCSEVGCNGVKPNLETLISLVEGHLKYSRLKADDYTKLDGYKRELLNLIKDLCTLEKPDDNGDFPHVHFLSKVTQRKATLPRVKIFTLNYDLLFERAANETGAIVLDGFSFTTPRTFSGRFFDYDVVQRERSRLKEEDNFVSRVFHLYKIHGSLNWERTENERVIIEEGTETPLMVYPRDAKYENSYEQPFFEMIARFQQNLRLDDAVLLCIGYSFSDKHINAVIVEALNHNPSFQLVVINPGFDKQNKELERLTDIAKGSERVIMIDETFEDFANHFPEIQTYYVEPIQTPISLQS